MSTLEPSHRALLWLPAGETQTGNQQLTLAAQAVAALFSAHRTRLLPVLKDWLVGDESDTPMERQLHWKGGGVVHASGASILAWVEVGPLCRLWGREVLHQWQGRSVVQILFLRHPGLGRGGTSVQAILRYSTG